MRQGLAFVQKWRSNFSGASTSNNTDPETRDNTHDSKHSEDTMHLDLKKANCLLQNVIIMLASR
jgi:hypothetical protein